MNSFKFITKILALLASAVLGRAQCTLPENTAYFAALENFESIGGLYCSLPPELQAGIEYLLGSARFKEASSPGFIAGCMTQFLPNFQSHLAETSFFECPPPNDALSFLTTAIRPMWKSPIEGGAEWQFVPFGTKGFDGNWCVNFDVCNMVDFREFLKGAIELLDGLTISDMFLLSSACMDNFTFNIAERSGNHIYDNGRHGEKICQSDATHDQCDNTKLIDVTLGDDEPFSIALCLDECNDPDFTDEMQLELTRRLLEGGNINDCEPSVPFCNEEPAVVEFSSEPFEVEEYCKAELRNARQGQCECKNNRSFRLDNVAKKTCEWFSYNDIRREEGCSNPTVRENCPILCGTCCADIGYFTFPKKSNGKDKKCKWLTRDNKKKERYCMRNKIRKSCPVVCDSCVDFIPVVVLD